MLKKTGQISRNMLTTHLQNEVTYNRSHVVGVGPERFQNFGSEPLPRSVTDVTGIDFKWGLNTIWFSGRLTNKPSWRCEGHPQSL